MATSTYFLAILEQQGACLNQPTKPPNRSMILMTMTITSTNNTPAGWRLGECAHVTCTCFVPAQETKTDHSFRYRPRDHPPANHSKAQAVKLQPRTQFFLVSKATPSPPRQGPRHQLYMAGLSLPPFPTSQHAQQLASSFVLLASSPPSISRSGIRPRS